jgi:hypothetical protein
MNLRLEYEVITIASKYIELKQDLRNRLFIEGKRCSKNIKNQVASHLLPL